MLQSQNLYIQSARCIRSRLRVHVPLAAVYSVRPMLTVLGLSSAGPAGFEIRATSALGRRIGYLVSDVRGSLVIIKIAVVLSPGANFVAQHAPKSISAARDFVLDPTMRASSAPPDL